MTREKRSWNMSRIRGTNTKPEEKVRKYLFAKGFRYRKNDKRLPGKPDIVLPKYKTVVFVNGCFWHGHENCVKFRIPKTNTEFWTEKIYNNIIRDKERYRTLKELGWNVIVVWECQLNKKNFEQTLQKLTNELNAQIN